MNSHAFTHPRVDAASFEPRYRAALNTPAESDAFMQLATEMESVGEPLWALFYDLATGNIDRDEALAGIEADFARGHAEEAWNEAAYAYETSTGNEWEASADLFDRADWIDRYAAQLDRGQAAYRRL